MKKVSKYIILFILLFLLFNCGKPLSDEHDKFVGIWHSNNCHLNINKRGIASYTYFKNGFSRNTSGPIKYIGDDKIIYKIIMIKKTLLIQKSPYQENGKWKMILENNEFTRISEQGWDGYEQFKGRFKKIFKKKN